MMSIGEFAQLTGLTVKALRHYDERGVLQPADVEPGSGYRRYGAGQVAAALRLRELRRAGMPLTEAGEVLAGGAASTRAVAGYRERLVVQRAAQDAALRALDRDLEREASGRRWRVEEQDRPAEPWVGALLPLDAEEAAGESDDEATERANGVFAAVWRGLEQAGMRPSGPPWSAFRVTPGSEETVQLLCGWPVDGPPPDGWQVPGVDTVTGCAPAGAWLVSSWSHDDEPALSTGQLHPAVLALLVEVDRRGVDVRLQDLRQVVLLDPDGTSTGVEVRVPLLR